MAEPPGPFASPTAPVPANVATVPSEATERMTLFPVSATNTVLEEGLKATPNG